MVNLRAVAWLFIESLRQATSRVRIRQGVKRDSPYDVPPNRQWGANGWMMFAFGMAPRIDSLLEQCETSPARWPRKEGVLTHREQQVLRHLASGPRNSDIANTLHLTVKTVEAHVKTVLLKLGVRNRTGPVSVALAHWWVWQQGSN